MADNSVYIDSGDRRPQDGAGGDADKNYVTLPVGTQLDGRYEILKEIGSGGFGIVYEARDLTSESDIVAIKEYFPDDIGTRDGHSVTAKRPDFRNAFDHGSTAFLEEARMLRRLEHPNIVRVYHWFKANKTVYIVMKRLRGRTMQETIDRGEQPDSATAMSWLRDTLQALGAVHKEGLLHRDVSPGNIYLDESGRPVLIDFGAARLSVGRLTKRLTAIAHAGYTPPEQYDDAGVIDQTPATDFYALGATFYHLLTGARPIVSIHRVGNDRLRPAAEVAGGRYPKQLLESIDKALQVQRDTRWQKAEDWLVALEGKGGGKKKWGAGKVFAWIVGIVLFIWVFFFMGRV